jgi:hypothetical protein
MPEDNLETRDVRNAAVKFITVAFCIDTYRVFTKEVKHFQKCVILNDNYKVQSYTCLVCYRNSESLRGNSHRPDVCPDLMTN